MLGYFGPAGTFTHQALLSIAHDESAAAGGEIELRPYASVGQALDAVRAGQVEAVLVPIENSVEGGVSATLDNLAAGEQLRIRREVLLPVQFGLYGRPGTTIEGVRRVLTHPHAAAQCRDWLSRNLPHASVSEGGSTAAAAQQVADVDSRFDAAVCAQVAADLYGLHALATGIADNESAVTRFVLVTVPGMMPAPTGADKTTLVAYMRADRPGGLLEILDQFASRGVNLSRLESRPTKTTLGSYCFSIDADGHLSDARMAEALMGLRRVCKDVVFLGSYPRADNSAQSLPEGSRNEDYAAARTWYDGLSAG